mgnify:CR=1 FL=1
MHRSVPTVVHGVIGDVFWDSVFDAAQQAARDMGVTLEMDRFERQESEDVLQDKMAARIRALCGEGVDGIFVSMPSEKLMGAVRFCKQLRIPVMTINAGSTFSRELNVQFIGQDEIFAGRSAAQRMILSDMKTGYCVMNELDNVALQERCEGFREYIVERNATYGGVILVPNDYASQFEQVLEEVVGDPEGNWDGIGLLLNGAVAQYAFRAQAKHQAVMLAKFDISEELFAPLDDGRLLFAIDQQQRLQGSMAVYMLSLGSYTKQFLINTAIETGPHLVEYAPSTAARTCEKLHYDVCTQVPEEDYNFLGQPWLIFGYCAFGLTCLTGLICFIWMCMYQNKNVVRASQPLFLGILVCGAVISAGSLITLGFQTEYRYLKDPMTGQLTDVPNPYVETVDLCCMLSFWFWGLGFAIMFAALCAKIHRIKLIYNSGAAMRRRRVEPKDVFSVMVVLFAAECAILLSHTLISPSQWERTVQLEVDGYVLESTGECTSEMSELFALIQVFFHAACVLYALFLCWQTSDIPSEFNESKQISLSVLCIFQVSILAIPIGVMTQGQPDVEYFVKLATVFLPAYTVLALIFFPKMWRVYSGDDELPLAGVAGRGSSGRPTSRFTTNNQTATSYYQQQALASSEPQVASDNKKSIAPSSETPRLSENSHPEGRGREVAPADRMTSVDTHDYDSDEEAQSELEENKQAAVSLSAPDEAYKNLKAGLDAEDDASYASSSPSEPADPVSAGVSLTSLAAEISRAEQTREQVYSSSVGENAPSGESNAAAPTAEATPRENGTKRPFIRRISPDMDESSPDSTTNGDGADPIHVDPASFLEALMPLPPEQIALDAESSAGTSSSARGEKNPQEGGSHVGSHLSMQSSNNEDPKREGTLLDIDNNDNTMETGSISTTAASTQGFTKADVSKAEIFRTADRRGTPIRLKKDPQAYGENAALAVGLTHTSFLRKVAASYGSASVSLAPSPSLESRSTAPSHQQSPLRRPDRLKPAPVSDYHDQVENQSNVESSHTSFLRKVAASYGSASAPSHQQSPLRPPDRLKPAPVSDYHDQVENQSNVESSNTSSVIDSGTPCAPESFKSEDVANTSSEMERQLRPQYAALPATDKNKDVANPILEIERQLRPQHAAPAIDKNEGGTSPSSDKGRQLRPQNASSKQSASSSEGSDPEVKQARKVAREIGLDETALVPETLDGEVLFFL